MRILTTIAFSLALLPLLWADQNQPVKLQGAWAVLHYDQNGVRTPDEITAKMRVTIDEGKLVIKPRVVAQYKPVIGAKSEVVFTIEADKSDEITYKLEPDKGRIDLVWRGPRGDTKTTKGLYHLEDDTLKICFALVDKNRPKKFPDNPKAGVVRLVLQRADK